MKVIEIVKYALVDWYNSEMDACEEKVSEWLSKNELNEATVNDLLDIISYSFEMYKSEWDEIETKIREKVE